MISCTINLPVDRVLEHDIEGCAMLVGWLIGFIMKLVSDDNFFLEAYFDVLVGKVALV